MSWNDSNGSYISHVLRIIVGQVDGKNISFQVTRPNNWPIHACAEIYANLRRGLRWVRTSFRDMPSGCRAEPYLHLAAPVLTYCNVIVVPFIHWIALLA